MAVNQHVNKVILNGSTLMDVSDNTITDEDMMEGVTATMPDGSVKSGKMRLDDIEDLLSGISTAIEGISGGGSPAGIRLANVSDTSITGVFGTGITISWMDPDDAVTDPSDTGGAATLAEWAGTKLVRKPNSAPLSPTDGVVIVDNKIRGQYAVNGYVDNTIEYGVTYYYRFFPYTIDGVYTTGSYVSFNIPLVSWVTSNDTDVIAAIQMAHNGEIDLYEDLGWRVGDMRVSKADSRISWCLVSKGKQNDYRKLTNTIKKKDGTYIDYPFFIVAKVANSTSTNYSPSQHTGIKLNIVEDSLTTATDKIYTNKKISYYDIKNKFKNGGQFNNVGSLDILDNDFFANDKSFIDAVALSHKPKYISVRIIQQYNGWYQNGVRILSRNTFWPSKLSLVSVKELGGNLELPNQIENFIKTNYNNPGQASGTLGNGYDYVTMDSSIALSDYEADAVSNEYTWDIIKNNPSIDLVNTFCSKYGSFSTPTSVTTIDCFIFTLSNTTSDSERKHTGWGFVSAPTINKNSTVVTKSGNYTYLYGNGYGSTTNYTSSFIPVFCI